MEIKQWFLSPSDTGSRRSDTESNLKIKGRKRKKRVRNVKLCEEKVKLRGEKSEKLRKGNNDKRQKAWRSKRKRKSRNQRTHAHTLLE